MPVADWRDQEAVNQVIFREMNEWTKQALDERPGAERTMDAYLCECSDSTCAAPINLTRSEYEAVRASAVRFAIAVDHEDPAIDHVLSENTRFATVEKLLSAAARIARATDPRRP